MSIAQPVKLRETRTFEEIRQQLQDGTIAARLSLVSAHDDGIPAIDWVSENRKLLSGETIYDDASFMNPAIKTTAVVQWLKNLGPVQSGVILLCGATGSGKTYGAIAYLGQFRDDDGQCVRSRSFVKAYRIAVALQDFKANSDEIKRLCSVKQLIIDDLGSEPTEVRTNHFLSFFDNLIDERTSRGKLTILTTNYTSDEFRVVYGDRVASRLAKHGYCYQTTDPDMRRA